MSHSFKRRSSTAPDAVRRARARPSSEGAEERHELRLVLGSERREPIARRTSLTVVREDRVLDRAGAPVVQEDRDEPQAPERVRAHLAAGGLSLLDAVAETAHVVEQEVGVRLERAELKRRHGARASRERAHVAAGAPDLCEEAGRPITGIGVPPAWPRGEAPGETSGPDGRAAGTRRWGEEAHEGAEALDILEIVIDARDRVARQQGAVALRAALVREQRRRDSHLIEV